MKCRGFQWEAALAGYTFCLLDTDFTRGAYISHLPFLIIPNFDHSQGQNGEAGSPGTPGIKGEQVSACQSLSLKS